MGEGLVLRQEAAADKEALVAFNAKVHGNLKTGEPDDRVGAWGPRPLRVPPSHLPA